ncbi:MAG TPA: hypothetical protein VKU89_04270 [Solirubrobacteraceae bacterium]|nr:hypothetical protein [Solirubrobacteraceae bacterium]
MTSSPPNGAKHPENGKPRRIVLPPKAQEAIQEVPPAEGSPQVFHSARAKRLRKGTLHYVWPPVAAAWRGRDGRDIDLYKLRHDYATLLLERGLTTA